MELLIVIVVIGILAAIALVSCNGTQSRAHDAAIRSDFRHIYKKLELYRVEHSSYPHFPTTARNELGGSDGSGTVFNAQLASLDMKLSVNSYNISTANTNVLYIASTDGQHYALLGYAKGNPTYYITNQQSQPQTHDLEPSHPGRYPGGSPGPIADSLGLPYDVNFYYIFVRSAGGYRIWN